MAIPRPPPSTSSTTSELIQAGVLVVCIAIASVLSDVTDAFRLRARANRHCSPPGRRVVAFLIPKGSTQKEQHKAPVPWS